VGGQSEGKERHGELTTEEGGKKALGGSTYSKVVIWVKKRCHAQRTRKAEATSLGGVAQKNRGFLPNGRAGKVI